MSKYIKKTDNLLARAELLCEHMEKYRGHCINAEYCDLLTDVQLLFFSDSPQNPLYVQAMSLNERRETVLKRYSDRFSLSDVEILKKLLLAFREYRSFLEAED